MIQTLQKLPLMFLLLTFSGATLGGDDSVHPSCIRWYPADAVRAGFDGTTVLSITVGVDGAAKEAHVIQSSGHEVLDRAATTCVLAQWHYKPAMKDGSPIEATTKASIVWKLHR